mmetsp:Transcript_36739/g.105048  ORF Transcript_36739/g.105048 Transcript_36739/m.105048 type:complete len:229 (+) Transcript_36739:2251-2937(+)
MSRRRSKLALLSSLLNQLVKFSNTNSVHMTARLPRISAPTCATRFGCRRLPSRAASRRNDVGTPSSLPAFVNSKSTIRSSAGSPVPRSLHLNSRPLERLSTSFSEMSSWSTRRRCGRFTAHSSLLCATSRQSLHAGAACSTRSRTRSLLNTSSSRLRPPCCRSALPSSRAWPSSRHGDGLPPGVTGSSSSAGSCPAKRKGEVPTSPSSLWLCLRRLMGEGAVTFSESG